MQVTMAFSPAKLLQVIEGARRDTSVHVRVINRLVILAEWREAGDGTLYYHVLYTWETGNANESISNERRAELDQCLVRMRHISNKFYWAATKCGNHAFIEFCGLMNDYISLCATALERGEDFTEINVHAGRALPMEQHHALYLAEKLECIYGPSFLATPELLAAFSQPKGGDAQHTSSLKSG